MLTLFLLLYVYGGDDYLVNLEAVSKTTKCRDFTVIFPVFFVKNARDFADFLPRFSCSPNYNDCHIPQWSWYCSSRLYSRICLYIFVYVSIVLYISLSPVSAVARLDWRTELTHGKRFQDRNFNTVKLLWISLSPGGGNSLSTRVSAKL